VFGVVVAYDDQYNRLTTQADETGDPYLLNSWNNQRTARRLLSRCFQTCGNKCFWIGKERGRNYEK